MLKKLSLYVMVVFYLLAGINHLRSPETYLAIIPPYIGHEYLINIIAGMAEIAFAILLVIPQIRRWSSIAIILMLIAFVPTHIYMIKANCAGSFCLPEWLLWIRLLLLQPLLILWAWWHRK